MRSFEKIDQENKLHIHKKILEHFGQGTYLATCQTRGFMTAFDELSQLIEYDILKVR